MRLALRMGVALLASGALATDIEMTLRRVMPALGLPGAEAVVTYSTVSISWVASGQAETSTAMQAVRRWRHDFSRLAAVGALARDIRAGTVDLPAAEEALDLIVARGRPYDRAVLLVAPGLSATAATVLFGGSGLDALATLLIALAIQPVLSRIGGSDLPQFFQVVAGVVSTAAAVVLLVAASLPIDGGLVLTGSVLRFLPGNALVAGMRDLIDRSIVSGTARLAEALLLGSAVAGGAALVLAAGSELGVRLQLSADGSGSWPLPATILAGALAVAFYGVQLGTPRGALVGAGVLGGLAVAVQEGLLTSLPGSPTLLAALAVGVLGRLIARRAEAPASLWVVPAILPLLPGLAIVQAMLAETPAQQASLLLGALVTAFTIGVGVASGDIVVAWWQQLHERVVEPAVGLVTVGVSALGSLASDRTGVVAVNEERVGAADGLAVIGGPAAADRPADADDAGGAGSRAAPRG